MSNTDMRNQQFEWDLLQKLYKRQLSDEILNNNLLNDKNVQSIFANFLIAYSYEKGTEVVQDKQKALEMYKYAAYHLLDPLSCYRLAELYSTKSDLDIDPDFQYAWFYLLLFSSMINPIYDIDFFKGTDWLQRILKQADVSFANSIAFIKEMINPILEPLTEVIQNLLLIKLNITYEGQSNQERYTATVDQLISILVNHEANAHSNLLYSAYNILFGLSFNNYNQISDKHFMKILDALCLQIQLTLNKVKELQLESLFSKHQIADNFFSQRLRRSAQQIFWIRFNIKHVYSDYKRDQNGQMRRVSNLKEVEIGKIKEIDEITGDILEVIYKNSTVKHIGDIILCKRIHAKIIYKSNRNLEQALDIINQELLINSSNINTQAYAEYLISNIFLKLNDAQKAYYFAERSYLKFNARINEATSDPIILCQSYYFKARIEVKILNDPNQALKSFTSAIQIYINNYDVFIKEVSFQYIITQKRILQKIIKITHDTSLVDHFIQLASSNNISLYLPSNYISLSNKNNHINNNTNCINQNMINSTHKSSEKYGLESNDDIIKTPKSYQNKLEDQSSQNKARIQIQNKTYSNIFQFQKIYYKDYEDSISQIIQRIQ